MAGKVDFGLWYDFRNPEPWQIDFEQFYAERLDQIERAETMGFDSVWLTEHHFCDDGYTPSPLVIHAAIAATNPTYAVGHQSHASADRRSRSDGRRCRNAVSDFGWPI